MCNSVYTNLPVGLMYIVYMSVCVPAYMDNMWFCVRECVVCECARACA